MPLAPTIVIQVGYQRHMIMNLARLHERLVTPNTPENLTGLRPAGYRQRYVYTMIY